VTLARILAALEQCRYRESEARDEQDLRDRRHHNAGVDAAEVVIRTELGRVHIEQGLAELATTPPQLPRHWLAEVP
jgi:hypothetical protein